MRLARLEGAKIEAHERHERAVARTPYVATETPHTPERTPAPTPRSALATPRSALATQTPQTPKVVRIAPPVPESPSQAIARNVAERIPARSRRELTPRRGPAGGIWAPPALTSEAFPPGRSTTADIAKLVYTSRDEWLGRRAAHSLGERVGAVLEDQHTLRALASSEDIVPYSSYAISMITAKRTPRLRRTQVPCAARYVAPSCLVEEKC